MQARKGLRVISLFEAVKGSLGLSLGIVALLLPHRDLAQLARQFVDWLRLDPAAHYTSLFIREASLIAPKDLAWVAAGAMLYALFRFVEAYGLWRERAWAEWLALVSCVLYVPFEIASLWRNPTWLKFSILLVNLVVVGYLALTLARPRKSAVPAPSPVLSDV